MQVVDAFGRIYEIGKIKISAGGSKIEANISKLSLKAGFYYLRILSAGAKPELGKLIVE